MILLITIFFFLSIIPIKPQAVEITAVVHSVISGLTISNQMKDRMAFKNGDPAYKDFQKKWRLLLPLEYLSAAGVGVAIQLESSKKPWYYYLVDLAEAGLIRVNVRQWVYQLDGNRHWLNQPNTDHTYFRGIEKFTGAIIKIVALGLVISFKYLILPLI